MYTISREVESAAFFPLPVQVEGITLLSHGQPESGVLHASGDREALDWRSALVSFEHDLRRVLDAVAVAAMVAASTYGGSVLVTKAGSQDAYFYFWTSQRDRFTLTEILQDFVRQLGSTVQTIDADPGAFSAARHYRESLLYPSTLVAAIHLLRAAEALAGKVPITPQCPSCRADLRCAACSSSLSWPGTDREALEKIHGTPTYRYFYKSPSLRNKLMHGDYVDQESLPPHVVVLRAGVEAALRSRLGLPQDRPLRRAKGLFAFRATAMRLRTVSAFPPFEQLLKMALKGEINFVSDPRLLTADEVGAIEETF